MPTPLYRATDARILGSLSRILDIGVNDNTQNSQWGPGPAGAFDDYPADAAPSFQSIGLPLIVAIGIGILLLVALVVGYIKFIRKNPSPSSTTTENSPSDGNDGTLRRRKLSRETRKQQLRNHFESYHVITVRTVWCFHDYSYEYVFGLLEHIISMHAISVGPTLLLMLLPLFLPSPPCFVIDHRLITGTEQQQRQ
jgi:hypothetical protein